MKIFQKNQIKLNYCFIKYQKEKLKREKIIDVVNKTCINTNAKLDIKL